jgi:hypothetical protein
MALPRCVLSPLATLLLASPLFAQNAAPADSTESLAKATQNPVASLISVPFQNNTNFAIGQYDRTQNVLNVQPVIPTRLGPRTMLISRIIQPILWQPYSTQFTGGEFGFGDMSPTFFLSPAHAGKLIWGVGPAWVFPTATNKLLGQGKVSVGPSVVALLQPGHWTLGALVNNVWSFAGSGGRPEVNQMTLQYFVTYNLKKGWNVSSSPILSANWNNQAPLDAANGGDTTSGGRWTVPFGGGIGRITRLGPQPVNLALNFYGNAVHPSGASSWGMRIQIALLYPQKPKP